MEGNETGIHDANQLLLITQPAGCTSSTIIFDNMSNIPYPLKSEDRSSLLQMRKITSKSIRYHITVSLKVRNTKEIATQKRV